VHFNQNLVVNFTKGGSDFRSWLHYHDNYEIYYLLSGKRQYFINVRIYRVSKGDVVIVKPYEIHRTTPFYSFPSPYERILLNINEQLFTEKENDFFNKKLVSFFEKGINVIKLDVKEQVIIEQILSSMLKEEEQQNLWYDDYMKALLVELLIFLNRCFSKERLELQSHFANTNQKLLHIISYINEFYMNNISLSSLSKTFYLAPGYLARIFKEATGLTCMEYINNVRTKEACKLLAKTNIKVTEIVERVGFNNLAHFERVFKKFCGCTASDYRKQYNSI